MPLGDDDGAETLDHAPVFLKVVVTKTSSIGVGSLFAWWKESHLNLEKACLPDGMEIGQIGLELGREVSSLRNP